MQRWKTETTELTDCKGSRKEGVVKEGENRETALRFIQHEDMDDLKENSVRAREQNAERGVLRKCESQKGTLGLKDL